MNLKQQLQNSALNKQISVTGQIVKKIETSGPTIYFVNDGTGVAPAKLFKGSPNINEQDYVQITGQVQVYNGEREINIQTIKLSPEAKNEMDKKINSLAEPATQTLSVNAKYLDLLKAELLKAARLIREAVFANRPIYVRHHCDVDGYSGGLQVQRAIQQIATDSKYPLRRSVMRAPFYEMDDIIRDIAMAEADRERFGAQPPLVVVLDNGSSTQDVDAIFLGQQHGFDFIVVDHHVFGERDAITPITLAHVNQLRVGNFETCTGFLAFELARMISPDYKEDHAIPTFAGISDRVDDEVFAQHLQKAGGDKELLTKFEKVLTWLLGHVPPCDNSAFLQKLFWSSAQYKQALVDQYHPMLEKQCKEAVQILELVADIKQVGDTQVAFIPADALPRRTYPKLGMATGLLFDKLKQQNPNTLVCGMMSDGIVLRVAPDTGTDVHKIIKYLNNKLPYPVLGGGHPVAGSVKLSKQILEEKELDELKQLVLEHVRTA